MSEEVPFHTFNNFRLMKRELLKEKTKNSVVACSSSGLISSWF